MGITVTNSGDPIPCYTTNKAGLNPIVDEITCNIIFGDKFYTYIEVSNF